MSKLDWPASLSPFSHERRTFPHGRARNKPVNNAGARRDRAEDKMFKQLDMMRSIKILKKKARTVSPEKVNEFITELGFRGQMACELRALVTKLRSEG